VAIGAYLQKYLQTLGPTLILEKILLDFNPVILFKRGLFFHLQFNNRDADLIAAGRVFVAVVIGRVRRFEILHFVKTFGALHDGSPEINVTLKKIAVN
jgi:hypothetical protein